MQLEFEHGIGNELVKQVVQCPEIEKVESRQIISSSDSDVVQLKHLLLVELSSLLIFASVTKV